jgi:predicted MFS family arabinose efflux permease
MSLVSSVQHLGNGLGAFLSSALLTTAENGALIGMEDVATLSILLAFIQPIILIMLARSKRTTEYPSAGTLPQTATARK